MGEKQEKIFASYTLSEKEGNFSKTIELKSGEDLLPGDYNVRARLSHKLKKKNIFIESVNFQPSESDRSPNGRALQGWTSLDKTYYWHPGKSESALTIPLFPQPTHKNISITDFDELHVDYNDLNSENPSLLSFKMIVSEADKEKNQATVIVNGEQLTKLQSSNLSSALWEEKGFSYLAKRSLGLPHDFSWNFIQKNKYFFYQNRFHLNLNAIQTH